MSENHTRLCEKIGNKKIFSLSEANLKNRIKSSPFCQRHREIESEIKWRIEKIKTQSYALVRLVGRELNQLSVPGILGAPTLKLRREMAIKPCAPGLDGRLLQLQETNILHLEAVQ